jgi:glycosyltransferase involved in cell wall biosynthesis
VVVFQARLEPAKDFHTALAAAIIILSEEPGVKVECFGSTLNVALPHGMKSLGIIAPAELRAAYNRASVFFSSSRYEGWGLPMAEAMACGAAVVSTRNGGVEDFLRDEVNGLLVPIENARAIADSVLRLLRDEKQRVRLATQGTHDAVLLSVQKSGEKLERVLESLLD